MYFLCNRLCKYANRNKNNSLIQNSALSSFLCCSVRWDNLIPIAQYTVFLQAMHLGENTVCPWYRLPEASLIVCSLSYAFFLNIYLFHLQEEGTSKKNFTNNMMKESALGNADGFLFTQWWMLEMIFIRNQNKLPRSQLLMCIKDVIQKNEDLAM